MFPHHFFFKLIYMFLHLTTWGCCLYFLPMDINGLQQAESHPGPQEEDVVTEDHDADEETSSQDECLSGMGVLCLHAKWRLEDSRETVMKTRACLCVSGQFFTCVLIIVWLIINSTVKRCTRKCWISVYLYDHVCFPYCELMVDFVDVFVDPAVVKQTVEEVVPGVLNNSAAKTLSQEVRPGGKHEERDGTLLHTSVCCSSQVE